MPRRLASAQEPVQAHANNHTNGHAKGTATKNERTDLTRWRLLDERGRQTWHYLATDEQVASWPASFADRYFLGLLHDAPLLPRATTPLETVNNGLSFFSRLQLPPGNWACEYGGPMFLLPGIVCTWHVTNTPIPDPVRIEIKRYLFSRQNATDGGWGLHIEGESTVYGTAMTYTILRLLGVDADDTRLVKARALLHEFGGAVNAPHWAKFWLATLGVMAWQGVNPIPPELWLLPDWMPIAPWRWWIHMRQVFLPMSYVYSRQWVCPLSPVTRQLREELYTQAYSEIDFAGHRNSIAPTDNYNPKSWLLNVANFILVWIWLPLLRTTSIKQRAEDWVWQLICMEDENTDYACLAPVNAALNTVACYIHDGPEGESYLRHIDRLQDYLWMTSEGMLCNGTDGVQNWDTAFTIKAVHDAGLAESQRWRPMLLKALAFLEDQQIRENCREQAKCYRQQRKGAWGFSTRTQGYTVCDTTSEGLRAVLLLQRGSRDYPVLVPEQRLRDAVDTILTMQNNSGGFSSYEPMRGSPHLELLNAAEVFGRIMVEYDYTECTTAVVTALRLFSSYYPSYRAKEIHERITRAVAYVRRAQGADGSWYGSWGICFTYAAMFALESLASVGETVSSSPNNSSRRGCEFLLSKQHADGGWGESYRACETGQWHDRESQVVMTSWALIGLMHAEYPHREPIERGIRLIMARQQANGEWLQEGIEGVFNKSVMISYPNYKFYFPIIALGMFVKRYGDVKIHV